MFDESSLKKIDSGYFNIILMDDRISQFRAGTLAIIGTCIVRSIRIRVRSSYFTGIKDHTRITYTVGRILSYRRFGAYKDMISGN